MVILITVFFGFFAFLHVLRWHFLTSRLYKIAVLLWMMGEGLVIGRKLEDVNGHWLWVEGQADLCDCTFWRIKWSHRWVLWTGWFDVRVAGHIYTSQDVAEHMTGPKMHKTFWMKSNRMWRLVSSLCGPHIMTNCHTTTSLPKIGRAQRPDTN